MTIDFNNVSNSSLKLNNKNFREKENILGLGDFEKFKIEEKPTNQLKLRRQKRQYDPEDTNVAKLFTAIREHKTGNPPKDKMNKIRGLLTQIRNINDVDLNDNGNTLLHVAVSKEHKDIVDLLLIQPNIDLTIKNAQGKTAYNLANDKYGGNPNWASTISRLSLPGSSRLGQQGVQQPAARGHETYSASGPKHSLHGNIYQLKLLMLFLERGVDQNYDFRLATEWDAAEKFDDLVFKYTDQGKTKYRFLQAKHKQDEAKKISIGGLLTKDKGGEFNLEKYFISYLKIKDNQAFRNGDLEDFIICTNIDFDLGNSAPGQPIQLNEVRSGKNKGKKISVEVINGDDHFFKQSDGGTRYKLSANDDLKTHLKQGNKVQEVIQTQRIQNIDAEINGFLEKLVFAVNQPNEVELSNIIGREIGEEFNLIDTDLVTDNFQKEMLDWMKEKGPKGEEGRFLSKQDGKEFFEEAKQKMATLVMIGPTSQYSKKLKEYNVEFESTKLAEINTFLTQDQKQILNLKSEHSTRLSAIKVNQALKGIKDAGGNDLYKAKDSYIFTPLSKLMRLQNVVLRSFNAQKTGNLLVIECKNGASDIQNLYSELVKVIRNNNNKKIILITKGDNELANKFKTDTTISNNYKEEDNIDSLNDLTSQSQEKVLEKTVNFQGNDVPLRTLISDDQKNLITEEILVQLIGGTKIKVGDTIPATKDHYLGRKFIRGGEEEAIIDDKAVIVAESGGGKSSTLIHLMTETKRENLYLWVVNIDFQLCKRELGNNEINNKGNAINFLSKAIKLQNPFEKQLFESGFDNDNKIALFFDGFDNVSGEEKTKIINLLNILKETQVKKLLITNTETLEQLQLPVYTLSTFSREEKTQLLQDFLKKALSEVEIDQTRLKSYSKALQDAFIESINDVHIREFIDTPLQMKMLAEVFQDEFKIFHDGSNSKPQIDKFNVVDLYVKFIEKKFKDFSQVLFSEQAPEPQKQEAADLFYEASLKAHTILAVNLLFPEDTELLLSEGGISKQEIESNINDLKQKKYNVGITEVVSDNIKFIHRTFAEYLTANFIKNELNKADLDKRQGLYEFLDAHLIESNTNVVRNFLDHFLAQDVPLHKAVLSGEKSVRQVLDNTDKESKIVNNQDLLGRTALHLAAAYGDLEVVKILLQNSAKVDIRDKIFDYTPITYADINTVFFPDIVELFLEHGADFYDLRYTESLFNSNHNSKKALSLLKAAVEENCPKLVSNLIDDKKLDSFDYNNILIIIDDIEDNKNESRELVVKYLDSRADYPFQSVPSVSELVQSQNDLQARKRPSDQDQGYYERFPKTARRSIESQLNQQQVFVKLEKTIKSIVLNAKIKSVRQGLYIPSFEQRNVKIAGKCAAITRGFSQSLFLGKPHRFLDNLETSAELYERLASGKQISDGERSVVFAFSELLNKFEQNIDSPTSSLPSSLSQVKSYKTLSDLSSYIRGIEGNFAIHLVVSNHVVAIYRNGHTYSYFDSNVALISNLKSVDELMHTVDQSVKLADYEVPEEGFLVERFNIIDANDQLLSSGENKVLEEKIKTERQLLVEQDQKLGPIEFNGQKLYRKTLYDMGAKLHSNGATTLINSGMSNALLTSSMQSGHLKVTAREYLQKLKGKSAESIQEIVQATRGITFEGARSEVANANAIKGLVTSEDGQKLNSYELNKILKAPMEGSLKTIPYYLEVAKARYSNPGRLVNAAGRISMIRGIHGVLHSASQGDMVEFSLGAGEIGFSMFSQLIEDKVVKITPKVIKQMKGGIYISRGVGGLIGNAFDIVDLVRSSIDLSKAEKGSKEFRDAIAGVTFSSASIVPGVAFTAVGATGAGALVGFAIVIGQGFYSGASMVIELKKYRLTTDEEFRTFWHTFALQPLPEDVQYITYRTKAVNDLAYQAWKTLHDNNDHVVAYAMGLGHTTLQDDSSVDEMSMSYQGCVKMQQAQQEYWVPSAPCYPSITDVFKAITPKYKIPVLNPGYVIINMTAMHYIDTFSRFVPPMSEDSNYAHICLPECPSKDEKFGYDCTLGVHTGYIASDKILMHNCENSMVIGHSGKARNTVKKNINGKVYFDLKLVDSGKVQGSNEWQNKFIIHNGTVEVHGGDNTVNTFTLMSPEFKGQIFGGDNATNVIDISNLRGNDTYYYNTLTYQSGVIHGFIDEKDISITTSKINYFIGSAERSETVYCSNNDDMVVDGKGTESDNSKDYIYSCKQVTIYGNTQVKSTLSGDYKFYVIPSVGSSSINIDEAKGLIIFPKTALLDDCSNITYSKKDNILSLIIPLNDAGEKFALNISNYLDEKNASRFTLIDKHSSVITPLIDLDRSGEELQIDSFVLNTEIVLNEKEIEKVTGKTIEEIWKEKLQIKEKIEGEYNATVTTYNTVERRLRLCKSNMELQMWPKVHEAVVKHNISYDKSSPHNIGPSLVEKEMSKALQNVYNAWDKKEHAIGKKWIEERSNVFFIKTDIEQLQGEIEEKKRELNATEDELSYVYKRFNETAHNHYIFIYNIIDTIYRKGHFNRTLKTELVETTKRWYDAYIQEIQQRLLLDEKDRQKKEVKEEEIRARFEACDDGIESACRSDEISIESIAGGNLEESEIENERTELTLVAVQRVLEAEKKVEQAKQKVLTLEAIIRDVEGLLVELSKLEKNASDELENAKSKWRSCSNCGKVEEKKRTDRITAAEKIVKNINQKKMELNSQLSNAKTTIIEAKEEEIRVRLELQIALNRARKMIISESSLGIDRGAFLDWHKSITQNHNNYKVYSVIKGNNSYGIVGSTKSDIIPLKEVSFAKGGEGTDVYTLLAEDIAVTPDIIEIDNEANDKELDILYLPAIPQKADVMHCYLLLYRSSNSLIKIKDYFESDKHRHLALIDDTMNMFTVLPEEGKESCGKATSGNFKTSDIKQVQLIPFYHATDRQSFYSMSEEKMKNHSIIAVDAHFNSTSFYRDYDDLLLMGNNTNQNKTLTVNLQGFYNNKNTNLYFYPDDYRLNLTEIARLAVDYQEAKKSIYNSIFKEYSVDLTAKNVTINHELEKSKIGIVILQNVAPSNIVIENNGDDLVFKCSNNVLTFKNWDTPENRISVLKFDEEIEITDINRFGINELLKMRLQIKRADLIHATDQRLQNLNHEVVNGLRYLLVVKNAENMVIGAYKLLGLDSVEEQQLFIKSNQESYNATTLKKVLCDDYLSETVEALVWLVVMGSLSLDEVLLVQCFSSLVSENFIKSIYGRIRDQGSRYAEYINKQFITEMVQISARNFKEQFQHNIRSSLESIDADSQERKRRAVGLNNIMSINEPKVSEARSSGTKHKSWINESVMWMKELVISVKDMISEPSIKNLLPFMFKKTLCHTNNLQGNLEFNIGQQYKSHKARIQSDGKSEFSTNQAFGFSNFLSNENTALAHCIADIMDNHPIKRYQDLKSKGVEVAPNSNTAVNWALERFNEFVERKINGLSVKEKQVIRTKLKDVYPEITASLYRGFEYSGNVGLGDVLEKCKECFCENILSPKSEEASAHLYDIEITTFGNNLDR